MMYGYYNGYPNGYPAHMFDFGFIGVAIMILFWILIIALIVRLIRGPRYWHGHRWSRWDRWDDRSMSHDTALDILKERYAKGEITKEQFEQMKRDIAS